MIEIDVLVKNKALIPDTARMIGWNEKSVHNQFKQSQKDGRPCTFKARVTDDQWAAIQRRRVKG